jgi:hypothetical protein
LVARVKRSRNAAMRALTAAGADPKGWKLSPVYLDTMAAHGYY